MKVLLIDDNKDITELLSKFLKTKGFETVEINDAMEGLQLIQQEHYDVILLDIIMSDITAINIIYTLSLHNTLKI